tara:strand:- start:1944 stop:2129 length:186 start_codon:yes stop_codon:yes gene_type:complete
MSKSTPAEQLGVALTGFEVSCRLGANYLFGRSCAMLVLLTISWSLLAAIFLFANAIVMVWG